MPEATAYLKVSQVASELQVTRQAVYGWIAEGRLSGIRLNTSKRGSVRVSRAALDAFISGSCVPASQAVGQ